MRFRVLDLFSGIGGFSLGLERTGGFETVAFCEIDPFCRKVLAKHWPNVRQYEDVRELTAERLRADGIVPDVICGGFPCQDISSAGGKVGIGGERSGLWAEYARLVGEILPGFVIVENVADLLCRGLGVVLGDLAALRYDAEWHCIPASAVGAPHRRDRLWVVAHPNGERQQRRTESHVRPVKPTFTVSLRGDLVRLRSAVANADAAGRSQLLRASETVPRARQCESAGPTGCGGYSWFSEPDVGRVADGVPARVDRLASLGNAVVPQIPEMIGRAILAAEQQRKTAA